MKTSEKPAKKRYYLIISFILLAFIELFLSSKLFIIYSLNERNVPLIKSNVSKGVKIFFGIITSEHSWYKRKVMKETWIDDIVRQGHDYTYCTLNRIEPEMHWIPLKNWTNIGLLTNKPADIDRMQKRITMAEYFLKNTSCDFFINPCDDVFVDSERIGQLASILRSKYNTNEDMVMLGHCIFHCFVGGTFLQGGAGYLMSRKMATKFVYFAEKWLKESTTYDDVEITRFLSYVNQTPKDCASHFFAGFGFHALKKHDYDPKILPFCPNVTEPLCGTGVMKFEDVYIVHPDLPLMKPSLKTWINFKNMLKDKKYHFGWYSNRNCRTKICRFN